MRIDSQHPGYLSGGHERPYAVDRGSSYEPDLPEVAAEVHLLVNEDFVEEMFLRPLGMMPFFGLDGIEELPGLEYDVGFDGGLEPATAFAAMGPEVDGVNAPGAAFSHALIVEPIGIDLDHIVIGQSGRVGGLASFHPDDAIEPGLAATVRTGTLPQSGYDGLALDPPGFDIRLPVIGADEIEYLAVSAFRPVPSPEFMHAGDGIDLLRRNRFRAAF